jgi:hypothetical protein
LRLTAIAVEDLIVAILVDMGTVMAAILLVVLVDTETLVPAAPLTDHDTVFRLTQLNVSEKLSVRGKGIERAAMQKARAQAWNGTVESGH